MMRVTIRFGLLVFLLWPVLALAQPDVFFKNLSDVPLMPGLTEMTDTGTEFDKPEGRIIESAALASPGVDSGAIRAFYARTLPQLGWKQAKNGSFVRQDEVLTIRVETKKHSLIARFLVAPR